MNLVKSRAQQERVVFGGPNVTNSSTLRQQGYAKKINPPSPLPEEKL